MSFLYLFSTNYYNLLLTMIFNLNYFIAKLLKCRKFSKINLYFEFSKGIELTQQELKNGQLRRKLSIPANSQVRIYVENENGPSEKSLPVKLICLKQDCKKI